MSFRLSELNTLGFEGMFNKAFAGYNGSLEHNYFMIIVSPHDNVAIFCGVESCPNHHEAFEQGIKMYESLYGKATNDVMYLVTGYCHEPDCEAGTLTTMGTKVKAAPRQQNSKGQQLDS